MTMFAYQLTTDAHFFWYELRGISHAMADRYDNSADNARFAFRRYDFLIWC